VRHLYEEEFFNCTHAGVGGVPWPKPLKKMPWDIIVEIPPGSDTNVTYEQDKNESDKVWKWVESFISNYGFK
jgi:hypothetical protein